MTEFVVSLRAYLARHTRTSGRDFARGLSAANKVDLGAWAARLLNGEASGAVLPPDRARGWLGWIVRSFGLFLIAGPILTWGTALSNAQDGTRGGSTFYVQYQLHEPVFLALMAAFAVLAARWAKRATGVETPDSSIADFGSWTPSRLVGIAALVFGLAALGNWGVMLHFPFAMDEYVAEFQAKIFATGRLMVTVPAEWQTFTEALRPVYVAIEPGGGFWTSMYWPIYSFLRGAFVLARGEEFLNPLFAAFSVVLAYASARRLWPNDKSRAWLAAIFLASSSQFLFMSMTAYAMAAHLFLSLLWLYAYARGDRAGWIATPIIGVVALGLHNPFPHALFVAPFLVQLVAKKQWRWTAYFAAVYGVGSLGWLAWMLAFQSPLVGPIPASQLFVTPRLAMYLTQSLSFTMLLTWQTPLLAMLTMWACFSWRSLSGTERCLLGGMLVSLAFHLFLYTSQGHGWGYRYTYATLGNMALLGASAASRLSEAIGGRTVRRLLVASVVLTIAVQWPIRAWQINHYIRPIASLHDYISHIDADVVIVDPTSSWYGIDLIRNDPFLQQRPKVLSAYYLRPNVKHALAEQFGPRVHLLSTDEIARFGIRTFPSRYRKPVWPPPQTYPLPATPGVAVESRPAPLLGVPPLR